MLEKRYLIVNADDFGRSRGVNRGIIEAYERGIVTSASLMARWPAATEAGTYAREHPGLSLGLHFDCGEWARRDDGTWVPVYEVVPVNDARAVADEVDRQLANFRQLVGRDPTHLDSHQHVHRREPLRSVLTEVAHGLGLPLRHCVPKVRYCGDFYGQTAKGLPSHEAISVDGMIQILMALPPGVTELACHPGLDDELESTYLGERAQEVKVLCHPRVRAATVAEGIDLRSFDSIALCGLEPTP